MSAKPMFQACLAQFSAIRFGGIQFVVAFHFSVPGAVHHVVDLAVRLGLVVDLESAPLAAG